MTLYSTRAARLALYCFSANVAAPELHQANDPGESQRAWQAVLRNIRHGMSFDGRRPTARLLDSIWGPEKTKW
jgi:hypothetical protein